MGSTVFTTYTVAELGTELRAGRLGPVELVEEALSAAERSEHLNAFVTLDTEGARAAAVAAAGELAGGVDRGPLHGIPVGVKDIIDTAGLRTTMGARHFAENVPARDAECVRRLRAAGAIVLGKTTTHEYAYGATGDESANGPGRNPFQPDRMSGGSSAGSAVAVAAGIVPLAVGTDTGGSVRIPAALCGLVGLRPTHGAVPLDGVFPLAPSLDTVGPLARTAADCRALWRVLSGSGSDPGAREPRIGWVGPLAPSEPEVVELTRRAAEQLGTVTPARGPDPDELRRIYQIVQGWEAHTVHAARLADAAEDYGEEVLGRLRAGAAVTESAYRAAREAQRRAAAQVRTLFADFDLLALPTAGVVAPPIGARTLTVAGAEADARLVLLGQTAPWGVAGAPALSLPAGQLAGLPVGLQLVAPPGGEDLLLDVAERAERT